MIIIIIITVFLTIPYVRSFVNNSVRHINVDITVYLNCTFPLQLQKNDVNLLIMNLC